MDTQNPDVMLPYLIIARFNGLRKDNPDDPENMVWVSEKGERYILTPKGFSHAVLLNYKIMYDGLKREYDRLVTDHADLERRYDQYKEVHKPDDIIGRGSKKKIKSIINSNNYRTIEEKFEAMKEYLKIVNP
jgi:hypothetical protein